MFLRRLAIEDKPPSYEYTWHLLGGGQRGMITWFLPSFKLVQAKIMNQESRVLKAALLLLICHPDAEGNWKNAVIGRTHRTRELVATVRPAGARFTVLTAEEEKAR